MIYVIWQVMMCVQACARPVGVETCMHDYNNTREFEALMRGRSHHS